MAKLFRKINMPKFTISDQVVGYVHYIGQVYPLVGRVCGLLSNEQMIVCESVVEKAGEVIRTRNWMCNERDFVSLKDLSKIISEKLLTFHQGNGYNA